MQETYPSKWYTSEYLGKGVSICLEFSGLSRNKGKSGRLIAHGNDILARSNVLKVELTRQTKIGCISYQLHYFDFVFGRPRCVSPHWNSKCTHHSKIQSVLWGHGRATFFES